MEWQDLLPGVIGSFVGVTGWLLLGLYIQRRQFMRQARNAAKAVYFELDVNRTSIDVARDHGLFADLDRSSFERLLPELTTLLQAADLRAVVDTYMITPDTVSFRTDGTASSRPPFAPTKAAPPPTTPSCSPPRWRRSSRSSENACPTPRTAQPARLPAGRATSPGAASP